MSKDVTKDVVDGFKAVADFWSAQGKAMVEAQQGAARSMVEGMQKMFGAGGMTLPVPDVAATPELAQAGEAMMKLWSAATELSTQLAGRLGQMGGENEAAKGVLERITDPKQWMLGQG